MLPPGENMKTVELQYGVIFGKGDGSDWFPWEITLDGAEEAAYLRAKKLWLDPNECEELQGVLADAYEEIKEQETKAMIDCGDEYAMECTGRMEMDPDELNDLVADRDPHALEFFGLSEADEEEPEEWDAHDLDELPLRCDFEEGFEPYSPFDEGWILNVQFPVPGESEEAEYLEEPEARETLTELLQAANGDYSIVDDYVSRCSGYLPWDSDLDLQALALEIAASLGLEDFIQSHSKE